MFSYFYFIDVTSLLKKLSYRHGEFSENPVFENINAALEDSYLL